MAHKLDLRAKLFSRPTWAEVFREATVWLEEEPHYIWDIVAHEDTDEDGGYDITVYWIAPWEVGSDV